MSLFHCDVLRPALIAEPTEIRTPLGIVRLGLQVGNYDISETLPASTYRVSGDGWLAVWQWEELNLELLVCRPLFSSPLPMPVTDCRAALWRIQARATIEPPVFSALWVEGYSWESGGPDSGQFLHAKTWRSEETSVTIGTQDDEMLALRVRNKDRMPEEWEALFPASYEPEDYPGNVFWRHPIHHQLFATGIACPLPSMRAGQECQIQFAVAWTDTVSLYPSSTALAVEPSSAEILAGGGCT